LVFKHNIDIEKLGNLAHKNLSRRSFILGTAGVIGAGLFAACEADDDLEDPVDDVGADPDDEDEEVAAEPEEDDEEDLEVDDEEIEVDDTEVGEVREFDDPEPGEPVGDQPEELVLAWGTYPSTDHGLDPQRHVNTIAENWYRHMYEPLIQYDRDLETISGVLAEDWERVDDLTVEFELREDVVFHNGEELDAEAVRFSILRPLSDEFAGDSRSTYAVIDDVEVVDDYTVRIITSEPDPALLSRLTGFHMTIIAPEWAEENPDAVQTEANGTGPYQLVEWSDREDLVMERFEDYWGDLPDIERVRCTVISEQSTRVSSVRTGEVHVAKDMPPEEIQSINEEDGVRIGRAASNRVPFYFITVDEEPYDDPLVRQAINYAANVQGVIEAILLGNGQRVSTVLPVWSFGFDDTLEPYPHDPERAMELLEEAGYPDGIDIDLWHIEGRYTKDREVAEAMAQEMAAAGINCETHLMEWATLVDMQRSRETPGLIFASWGNWIFDADNTFFPLFSCQQAEDVDFDWTRPYCDEEFEELITDARFEMDEDDREQLYADAQQYMYDEAAALFMYQLVDIFGINDWVAWEPRHDEMMWAHDMSWNN
jgi:peptide/nickel transport system substrate-binding protein